VKIIKYAATENISLEAGDKEISTISADGVFYHLKKLSMNDVNSFFEEANEKIVKKAERLLSKPVIVAIDFHDVPYYGEKRDVCILGCKNQKGTSWCHRYATIEIVEGGRRLTLAAMQVNRFLFANKSWVVKKLLERAMRYVKIKIVLLDRGFFSSDVIQLLNDMKLDWLMPVVLNRKIKYIMKTMKGYKMRNVAFNLIVGNWKWATNMNSVCSKLIKLYKKRWGIETGYRVKKDFKIKTCTNNHVIRTLFFFIQILMYNFWTNIRKLTDFIRMCGERVKAITTRLFKKKIMKIT